MLTKMLGRTAATAYAYTDEPHNAFHGSTWFAVSYNHIILETTSKLAHSRLLCAYNRAILERTRYKITPKRIETRTKFLLLHTHAHPLHHLMIHHLVIHHPPSIVVTLVRP
jgi:hypothetical protein